LISLNTRQLIEALEKADPSGTFQVLVFAEDEVIDFVMADPTEREVWINLK